MDSDKANLSWQERFKAALEKKNGYEINCLAEEIRDQMACATGDRSMKVEQLVEIEGLLTNAKDILSRGVWQKDKWGDDGLNKIQWAINMSLLRQGKEYEGAKDLGAHTSALVERDSRASDPNQKRNENPQPQVII